MQNYYHPKAKNSPLTPKTTFVKKENVAQEYFRQEKMKRLIRDMRKAVDGNP